MVQSIELLLDDDGDAALRASWAALADAGLPSLADHTGRHEPAARDRRGDADGTGFEAAVDGAPAVLRGLGRRPASGLAAAVGAPVLFGGHRAALGAGAAGRAEPARC